MDSDYLQVLDSLTDDYSLTEIRWERVFLHLTVRVGDPGRVDFRFRKYKNKNVRVDELKEENGIVIEIQPKTNEEKEELGPAEMVSVSVVYHETPVIEKAVREGDYYHLTVNMPAADGRSFLDNGQWQLAAYPEEGIPHTVIISHELAYNVEDYARIFRYGGSKFAYNVSFSYYSDRDGNLTLRLHSYFMTRNDDWKTRHYVQEANTKKGRRRMRKRSIAVFLMRLWYNFIVRFCPRTGKNVLFMTETKDYLWGNLKYINDRIYERGLDKEFNISYSLRQAVGRHTSAFSWARVITKIAKQDYIFVDDYVPVFGFIDLKRGTKLIQVWHAGEGFKAVGYCRFGRPGTPFPAQSCHKKYDYVITGSEHLVKIFEEVFGIPEDAFLPLGMARLDGFLDKDKIAKFKDEFYQEHPELKGKKIILFAPTYRGKGQGSANYDYSRLDLGEIYDFCGDEYVWMFKMHPFVRELPEIPEEYQDRIVDFSGYQNINDLYYVTDLLITDYSSNYFEYALLEKPVLFYTYDREVYELTRGVHRSVKESAPGKVCDSFEEMMTALRTGDFEEEKIHQFVQDNFSFREGLASDRVIDSILLKKEPEENDPEGPVLQDQAFENQA